MCSADVPLTISDVIDSRSFGIASFSVHTSYELTVPHNTGAQYKFVGLTVIGVHACFRDAWTHVVPL